MQEVRAALIGCGGLGQLHTRCTKEIEGLNMVAFCDIFAPSAEQALSKYGGEYATSDAERIFSDPTIDAVYVVTQHDTHAELAIRALQAGKHVIVEKPLALTLEDCLAVAQTVEVTGKKLMTAFKMRYYELLLKAKQLIPKPLLITMQMMDNRWADDRWPNDPVKGGGNVLSQGVHSCDILRFIAGVNPIEVYAVGDNYYQQQPVIDNLTATFRFEDRIAASWVQGDCHCPPFPSKFFMQIFAENCSITLNERLTQLIYTEAGKDPVVFKGTETGFLEENRAFYRSIVDNTKPEIDHIDGLYATLMVLQAFASIRSGKPEPIHSVIETGLPMVGQ